MSKIDRPNRSGQWGCIGTVLGANFGALISGIFLILATVIQSPGTQQPIIIQIINPLLERQDKSVVVITATPYPTLGTATQQESSSPTLYQSDWSNGFNGWPSGNGWQVISNMLLSDGTLSDGNHWKRNWIAAPYKPTSPDYTVEAEIQMIRNTGCGSFGVVARSGYQAGFEQCGNNKIYLTKVDSQSIGEQQFNPGTSWHTYRLTVKANTLKVAVDGAVMIDTQDNQHLTSEEVGLYVDRVQINVRSFTVSTPK